MKSMSSSLYKDCFQECVGYNIWKDSLIYMQHLNKYSALGLKTKDLKLLKKISAVFPSKKKKIRNSMGKI